MIPRTLPDWEKNTEWEQRAGWAPQAALRSVAAAPHLIDGLLPQGGITWLVGAPSHGKTFVALSLAGAVSAGRDWMGRACEPATVVYVAAEGGTDVHIRRAAMELHAGVAGRLQVVQTRPQIPAPEGLAELMALVQYGTNHRIGFDLVRGIRDRLRGRCSEHLRPDERAAMFAATGDYYGEADDDDDDEEAQRPRTDSEIDWAAETRLLLKVASRSSRVDHAVFKHSNRIGPGGNRVLLIIDTYSQTSPADDKAAVSAYIKNLRDLVEASQGRVSVLVVDHLTKAGDTYMGALAKLGDVDAMITVTRKGDLVTLSCDKMKTAAAFDDIHLTLTPHTLDGYADSLGRPLKTLVVEDGRKAHLVRKAAGASGETAAALLLTLLDIAGGICTRDDLRQLFLAHPTNVQKKADTAGRAFLRALDGLTDDGVVQVNGDAVTYSPTP